jgi:lactoylglutathione lyase
MKFRYTILYVKDVPSTLAFYEQAFSLKKTMLHGSGDYGELDTGTTKLAFSSIKLMNDLKKFPGKPDISAPIFEIAFETECVQEALDRALGAGAKLIQGIREEPWGQTTSYVSDENGFLIEICSPAKNQS